MKFCSLLKGLHVAVADTWDEHHDVAYMTNQSTLLPHEHLIGSSNMLRRLPFQVVDVRYHYSLPLNNLNASYADTMERRNSYCELLKIPRVPALILTAGFSRLAGSMFALTLVLFTLAQFPSSALTGWLTFTAIVPGLIVSPMAGALLNRVGPMISIRIDMMASAIFVAGISIVGWAGFSNPVILFMLVMLFSLAGPLGTAGMRVLLPSVVPPHALPQVNALDAALYATADVVGPATAGMVVAWLGPEVAMFMIAMVYTGAALCLLRVKGIPRLAYPHTSLIRQTIEGIQIVVRQPTLRGVAVSYSLYQITWGALYVTVPVFVADNYATAINGPVIGLLWAATGIAGGLGALFSRHLCTTGHERHVMAAGMMVTAFAVGPLTAQFGLEGLIISLILAGAMSGPVDVAVLTLRQRRTEPQQLGRVMSISMSLNRAGFPLGSAVAGTMTITSPSSAFVLAGVASAVAAFATVSIPRN